jgi:hypothetical protein
MSDRREMTVREFVNVARDGRYPVLRLDADQWGEHGFFYDPLDRDFGVYDIDRKEQTHAVVKVDTPNELFPACADHHQPRLRGWLASFRVGTRVSADETLIWYPASQQLARYPLDPPPLLSDGTDAALAALDNPYAREWLQEQIRQPS